jgi:catechol 2,3-dioxygenase-like lactoylglutathione lyase family enzyme
MLSRQSKQLRTLSSRAKRGICLLLRRAASTVRINETALFLAILLFVCISCSAQDSPQRPRILGVGSVAIAVPQSPRAMDFYIKELGFRLGIAICRGGSQLCLGINSHQRIDLIPPEAAGQNNLVEVTFETSDIEQLHRYLESRGTQPQKIEDVPQSNRHFSLLDPEGHRIGFIQYLANDRLSHPENQVSAQLIHAGFVVHDRAAEDRFYKDILGFHVYWHGGMKDDQTDWVDMQVPDGTDWLEYMLNVSPSADKKELGVMNHIALGVPDIKAAREQLLKNGMKLTEEPQNGRDGKWQLNLYDPDDTRVELMEFTPVQKPCCSEYTGPHPKP